jgi:hypothetical protein
MRAQRAQARGGQLRIFISYHTPDLEKARAVEAGVARRAPANECYLAPRSNLGGAYWLPRLAHKIARADAVLLLAARQEADAALFFGRDAETAELDRRDRGGAGEGRQITPAPFHPGASQLARRV